MPTSNRWSVAVLLACALSAPLEAHAWKPYTHNYTGERILADLDLAGARVRLDGKWYPIDPRIAAAIAACPSCYMAGTVGPDGFPDLVYGQSVIHPMKAGEWLRRLVDAAWAVQTDPRYGKAERAQALAFTYGFLTHAAGDVWGHTLVNEFARGIFPAVSDVLKDAEEAGKAIRHVIIEGVVGDATPGYDANPDRTVAPGGYGLTDGDVSEDSTPGHDYAVPVRFVYEALVDRRAPTPRPDAGTTYRPPAPPTPSEYSATRGMLIARFYALQDGLADFVSDNLENPLDAALDDYDLTMLALRRIERNCNFHGFLDFFHDLYWCPRSLAQLGWAIAVDSAEAFEDAVVVIAKDLAYIVLDAYVKAWRADIDRGLQHWAELGLATTQALFDAQTRRGVQNYLCRNDGTEDMQIRENCEKEVGLGAVLLENSKPFLQQHGLSMIGAPDVVGKAWAILDDLSEEIEDMVAVLELPFQPFKEAKAHLREYLEDLVLDAISQTIGMDVDQLGHFLKRPHNYVCMPSIPMKLPKLGTVTIPLFDRYEHDRLDEYLGLAGTDHHVPIEGVPELCGFLRDDVVLDPAGVAPVRDTIIMGKLALMTGPQLDALLGGILGREIRTYEGEHDNILVTSLGGKRPWLMIIDGDHEWRSDRLAVFEGPGAKDPDDAQTGWMPLWESCVLRPAFRSLFEDWENPWHRLGPEPAHGHGPYPGEPRQRFPQLNDYPSSDVVNDPAAPASWLDPSGTFLVDGSTVFVGRSHALAIQAAESDPARGFPADQLTLVSRVYTDPLLRPAMEPRAIGATFSVAGPDGTTFVDFQAGDPCHPLRAGDDFAADGSPGELHTVAVVLDTTAPQVECGNPPFGRTWPTDAVATFAFAVTDAGSGLRTKLASLDGVFGAAAPAPVASGAPLDAYRLVPGRRTVTVTAADRVGNGTTRACTFDVIVTARSLRANLARANREGQIEPITLEWLVAKLDRAVAKHDLGLHAEELEYVRIFAASLAERRQYGKVDAVSADHLGLYASWFIAHPN